MYEKFNQPDTLGIISSFPAKNGELARGNAISRYTHLLAKDFPKDQKVVVFCEVRKTQKPFLMAPNILVVPTYRINSLNFFTSNLEKILNFDAISNILMQFEFSIFGGKIIIPQLLILLLSLKLLGKSVKITFHQVVTDLNILSGHLAIKKNDLKTWILNILLKFFYTSCGILSDKIIVHDKVLAKRLSRFVSIYKIRIIPHGMAQEQSLSSSFIRKSKKYFGVKNGTKLVGIFGYCSWYKGTDWLIENFARFARENPDQKIRLLVAGGQSPTLKGTLAYRRYHQKLQKVIKKANGNIIYTGFVPEKDVRKVFAAVDLFVFPYRAKMSASGAFSLCLGYQKPYIVSRAFAENIDKNDTAGRTFALNYNDFTSVLENNLQSTKTCSREVYGADADSLWGNVSLMYLKEILPETSPAPKLSYA